MQYHERRRLYWGGVTGGSFIAVTQLMTRDVILPPQLIALVCFAVVLPFGVMFTNWPDEFPAKDLPGGRKRAFELIASVVGMLFWIGIAALFFAFKPILAFIFLVSTAIAWLASDSAIKFLRSARSKKHSDATSGNTENTNASATPAPRP
jgi:Na+/H+ antiporter NhaD/arsenite permease-like protein